MNSRLKLLSAAFFLPALLSAAPGQSLKLEEVLELVRTNLTDVSEAELSEAAAYGLLEKLGAKVQLVSANSASQGPSNIVTRLGVYGRNFSYFRIETVSDGLAPKISEAWQSLAATNRMRGTILDLRYAKGQDYQAAARTADLFVQNEQSLFQAGDREFRSSPSGPKIKSPVAVLVNRQTSGAAEALAACLRQTGAALLIGGGTAGEARVFETFELSTGQFLRIGKVPVQVGGQPIPASGIAPDIAVEVSTLDERAYYQDPFLVLPRLGMEGGTNGAAPRGRRFNEADLVRRHREGLDLSVPDDAPSEPGRQIIMDPALARAVDFLKGLAALRPSGSD